ELGGTRMTTSTGDSAFGKETPTHWWRLLQQMQDMALKHSEPPHQLVDAFQPKAPRPGMSGAQTGCQPDASHHRDRGSTTQRTRTYTLTVVAQGCRRRPGRRRRSTSCQRKWSM